MSNPLQQSRPKQDYVKLVRDNWYQYNDAVMLKYQGTLIGKPGQGPAFLCSERIVDGIHSFAKTKYRLAPVLDIIRNGLKTRFKSGGYDYLAERTRDKLKEVLDLERMGAETKAELEKADNGGFVKGQWYSYSDNLHFKFERLGQDMKDNDMFVASERMLKGKHSKGFYSYSAKTICEHTAAHPEVSAELNSKEAKRDLREYQKKMIDKFKEIGMLPIDTTVDYGARVPERTYNLSDHSTRAFAKIAEEFERQLLWGEPKTKPELLLVRRSRRLK